MTAAPPPFWTAFRNVTLCLTLFLTLFPSSALAALEPLSDPAGDAVGDGSLALPTAPVYRRNAFDLLSVDLPDTPTVALELTMASLDNPWRLPNGFSLPVIEIYLDTDEEAGRTELLHGERGSNMSLPAGVAWDHALYITGDAFRVFSGEAGELVDVTEEVGATLELNGNMLNITTRLPRPEHTDLYAVVGSYDPLTESGWRPVSRTPSPGTLSSPTQVVRVVDVLADTLEAQESAVGSGVLPRPPRRAPSNDGWLLLSAAGLLLSLVGVGLRLWTRAPRRAAPPIEPAYMQEDEVEPQEAIFKEPTIQERARQEYTPPERVTVPAKAPVSPVAPPPAPRDIPVLELPLYTPTIVGASGQPGFREPLAETPKTPVSPLETPHTPDAEVVTEVVVEVEAPSAEALSAPPTHRDAAPLDPFRATLDDEPLDNDWLIWSEDAARTHAPDLRAAHPRPPHPRDENGKVKKG